MEPALTAGEIARKARALMPGVLEDLKQLIRHPSVAFPGYPPGPVLAAAEATVEVLRRAGLPGARLVAIPGGYPFVYGEIPAPPGAPTILLYAHYDVQPARKEDGWDSDPWTPEERDGRLYGRGAADNKSGILIIAAALKIFDGRPPVGVKVIIEGEEETASHLGGYVAAHPEFFWCDLFAVADTGNITVGDPVLTTTLRGEVSCTVTVRTLARAVHSGSFGGPAPDALVVLIRMLSTLHDPEGGVAVKGLRSFPAGTADYPEAAFRQNAGVLPGVDLTGTGSLGSRLWLKPSVTVIGIDAPAVAGAANILIPRASARVSMRIAPDADPRRELAILTDHLRAAAPWNAKVGVHEESSSPGFVCPVGGPGIAFAHRALEAAFGKPAREKGTGGSIPLMRVLRDAVPGAEFVLWGASDDAGSFIHGPNESVDTGELERFIVAQALLLQGMGERRSQSPRDSSEPGDGKHPQEVPGRGQKPPEAVIRGSPLKITHDDR